MTTTLFGTEPKVNRFMLALARESRGLTQKELAERTGISQGNISKYENGLYNVSREHLDTIAKVLEYNPAFFELEERIYGLHSGSLYHRRRQTMPVLELKKWQAKANIIRIQVDELLRSVDIHPANMIPRLEPEAEGKTAAEIAQQVRRMWGIPRGPIRNIIQVLEDAGAIVVRLPFGTQKIDAMILLSKGSPPLILANAESPTDRFRFSMAHELGHLIMHQIPSDNGEAEADSFASEFLMPAAEIRPYLHDLTMPKLAEIKVHWRTSMAAAVRRAKDLEVFNDSKYRQWMTKLSAAGYRTKEPLELSPEEPTIMPEIVRAHFNIGYSPKELSKLLYISEEEFSAVFDPRYKGMTIIKGKSGIGSPSSDGPKLRLV